MGSQRKVKITIWALTYYTSTAWLYMVLCGIFHWPLSDAFFSTFMGGISAIGLAFYGANMYEHKKTQSDCEKPEASKL